MAEVFIFLIVVGVGAVVVLVIQSGGGMFAIKRPVARSVRSAGLSGSPQSSIFQSAAGPFYPKDGGLKSGHFADGRRGDGVRAVVRPSGDYTALFRGKEGTPQPVGRQVYGLPPDRTGAPPAGMTQEVYARKLAGANPKVAAEIIKQWIRSS